MEDQFRFWRDAITNGTRIETERGNPRSGYFKQVAGDGRVEVIAIARNETGKLECFRTIYGDGSKMSESEIDDLFGKVCVYPIAQDVFEAVWQRNEELPPEYGAGGKLTMKDQAAGVAWSPAYGRKRLGLDIRPQDAAENPRAVIGNNRPPEPTEAAGEPARAPNDDPQGGHVSAGEQTPDKVLFAEASAIAAECKKWLASIGNKPRNKPEADRLTDYGTVLKRLAKKAHDEKRAEKSPLEADLKAIEAKWQAIIGVAKPAGEWCHATSDRWVADENKRLEEEAKKAAEAAAKDSNAPPPEPPREIRGTGNVKTVTGRNRDLYVVTDARAYLAHLLKQDGELPGEIVEAAGKVAQRRAEESPGVEKRTERRAA